MQQSNNVLSTIIFNIGVIGDANANSECDISTTSNKCVFQIDNQLIKSTTIQSTNNQ